MKMKQILYVFPVVVRSIRNLHRPPPFKLRNRSEQRGTSSTSPANEEAYPSITCIYWYKISLSARV